MTEFDYDVVVLGAGAAGLAASIEAADNGASVLLAEASNVIGGSSRLSGGIIMGAGTRWQKALGIDDSPEALYEFYMSVNQWNVTPGAVWRLCQEVGPAIEWAADLGVPIVPTVIPSADEPVPRGHPVDGMGQALVDGLYSAVKQRNVDVALNRRVDRLLVENGSVVGVGAGSQDEVRARTTIMATGGFGANFGLLHRYVPQALRGGDWAYYVGATTSQGDSFKLCDQVGAPITGSGRAALSARPNFGRDGEGEFPGWLMLVDDRGRRFFNEMAPYAVMEHIMCDRAGPVWAILDDETKRRASAANVRSSKKVVRPGESVGDWVEDSIDRHVATGEVKRAESITELAYQIGVPAANLLGTVETYNEAVSTGADSLFRKNPALLKAVSTPPFYAAEIRLRCIGITMVGPMIDDQGRVIGEDSRPIAGLYAAGECTGGVMGHRYVGSGNSLGNSLAFGRVTGRSAAALSAHMRSRHQAAAHADA